jgi:hypothetical protein
VTGAACTPAEVAYTRLVMVVAEPLTRRSGAAHDDVVERVTVMLVSSGHRFLPEVREPGKKWLSDGHPHTMTVPMSYPAAHGCSHGLSMDVRAWRRCRLLEAGFQAELAECLATDSRFDLHALLALVDRGCPPDLAVRILAPLPKAGAW